MEGMTTDGKLLGQDDIDALLNEAGLEGDYSDDGNDKEEEVQTVAPPPALKVKRISDNAARNILEGLFQQAFLQRENGIKVIWNASKAFPMSPGVDMKIEGVGYKSLGVLFNNHLIVGCNEQC